MHHTFYESPHQATQDVMANHHQNTQQLYQRVERRRRQLRQAETRARRSNLNMQPRRINFRPDMLDNYYVLGTRAQRMHDEIRVCMEESQFSPQP